MLPRPFLRVDSEMATPSTAQTAPTRKNDRESVAQVGRTVICAHPFGRRGHAQCAGL